MIAINHKVGNAMSEHYLFFTAPISQQTAATMVGYLVDLQIAGATKLTLAVSSPGGNVVAGITIYNTLMSMPFEIVTHNIGNVDSIANVVFLAGSKRLFTSDATFMFHGVGFDGNSNERLEEKNILEKLDTIKSENTRISSIVSSRSNLTQKACMALLKLQRTRGASWAKTSGLVHDIVDFKIPANASVKHLSA